MIDPREATDAGALISYGLTGRVPNVGAEYGQLYDRYKTDPTFRALVDGIASGLGLTVIGTPITGIVLTARAGSPFDLRLSDLPGGDRDERLVLGLVLLGIAAYAYPKPEDLDIAEPVIVTIGAVERLMRAAIAPLAKLEAVDGSIESYAASAAAAYERMPGLLVTDRGARRKHCTEGVIEDAFRLLIEQKMAHEGPRHGVDAYVLTDRFRISVAEVAGSDALEALRDISLAHRVAEETR
jgi:hypothetical protein